MTINSKLDIIKLTRKIAADSLYTTLQKLLKSNKEISEVLFRDAWLSELRKHKEIFPDGWYMPPPHGMGVLFATEDDNNRVNYKTLRPESNWPKKTIFLDKTYGFAYLYASPVDKKTGLIGDFGLTLYFGKNPRIKKHLITTYKITQEIFKHSKIGMRLSDLARYGSHLFQKNNLINTIQSSSDPVGTNIGHSIPSTDIEFSAQELKIFKKSAWKDICKILSQKRIFVNEKETIILKGEMAITIEPRPEIKNQSSIPMVSFHTIGLYYPNNKKEQLTNFDNLFRLTGMDYML